MGQCLVRVQATCKPYLPAWLQPQEQFGYDRSSRHENSKLLGHDDDLYEDVEEPADMLSEEQIRAIVGDQLRKAEKKVRFSANDTSTVTQRATPSSPSRSSNGILKRQFSSDSTDYSSTGHKPASSSGPSTDPPLISDLDLWGDEPHVPDSPGAEVSITIR
eukprot:GILK01010663.1.p1 GENE.GILK01010663.1~~GILK01010663.1.p1  ORF type:complete len:161 (-),score=19.14 GILK01010663.1:96-578(-)